MRISLLLFFISCFTLAQEVKLDSVQALNIDRFVGIDSYGHMYFIHEGALHKEGALGKFVFQDFQLGPIKTIDMINPLNVVVYYAEVNTVVFLDNRLNEKERINFNNLDAFLNIGSATNAGNNRLWVFNLDTQQLELFNYRTSRETVFSQPYEGELLAQVSDFNDCLLLTNGHVWRVNIYGSLLSELPSEGFETVVSDGKRSVFLKENQLFLLQEESFIPLEIDLNENNIKDLQLTQDFLYIYDGKNLSRYTLTQPKQ